MPESISLRVAVVEDLPAITDCYSAAFLFDDNPVHKERIEVIWEPERWLVAEENGRVVGTGAILTRDLSVPGGSVPAAHVTAINVRPDARRRGTLGRLMRRQFADATEPIAVLWSSQSALYRRYGYRHAVDACTYEGDMRLLGIPDTPVPGRVREISAEDALELLPPVFELAATERPGMSSRDAAWWRRQMQDPESERHGATAMHVTVHENADGAVDGYVIWRVNSNWTLRGAEHQIAVEEIVAPDHGAYLALWQWLAGLDMAPMVFMRRVAAMDERLRHLVTDPRQLQPRVSETLWVRVLDVPRALAARAYSRDVDVVLEITDRLVEANRGRFRLTVKDDVVTCVRTDDPADLSMDVDVLGGAYLGGRSLALYASIGEVTEHTPGALRTTAAAFLWHVAPHSVEIF